VNGTHVASEPGASSGALRERVHGTEFRVQTLARDINASLDHLSRNENGRISRSLAEELLKARFEAMPVAPEESGVQHDELHVGPAYKLRT
jgi:hypothetical protein